MKNNLLLILVFSLGIAIGATVTWVNSYYPASTDINQASIVGEMLVHSNTAISSKNYACEGKPVRTVGAVVASLLELNSINDRNMLSYGCYDTVCTMSVSNCKPWQEQECGSRFLKFTVNERRDIDVDSFSCFDVP